MNHLPPVILISPRDDVAGRVSADRTTVTLCDEYGAPSTAILPIGLYLSRYPDTVALHDASQAASPRNILRNRKRLSVCLDMTLLLFDADVSLQTRREVAKELESLCSDHDLVHSVLDILLSKPLSSVADIDGAVIASEASSSATRLISAIVDNQRWVSRVFSEWQVVEQTDLVSKAGAERVFALLSRAGIFRRLVFSLGQRSLNQRLKADLTLTPMLGSISSAPRIVSALYDALATDIDSQPLTPLHYASGEVTVDDDDSSDYLTTSPSQHSSTYEAHKAALSQVDRVVDLFLHFKDAEAHAVLDELIVEHLKWPDGQEYVVKSLCNVAQKTRDRAGSDVAFECLSKALEFPKGIDSLLYQQIGHWLRDLRRFDEALKCYDLAEKHFTGSVAAFERLTVNRIKILVDQDRYDDARLAYVGMPDYEMNPDVLVALGTLYRRMGKLDDAAEAYRGCLALDPEMHSAQAGLAEVWKQKGDLHRSIREYIALLKEHIEIKDRHRRVYQVALSRLFRMTYQPDRAEAILQALLVSSPFDPTVNAELGKLCLLRGDRKAANDFFSKAKDVPSASVLQAIFEHLEMSWEPKDYNHSDVETCRAIAPEDPQLGICVSAFDAIMRADYEHAMDLLGDAKQIDQITSEFAAVLRYHAVKLSGAPISSEGTSHLRRLSKHAYRGVRDVVKCLEKNDFRGARIYEAEFFARVA